MSEYPDGTGFQIFSNARDFNGRLTHSNLAVFKTFLNQNPAIDVEIQFVDINGDEIRIGFPTAGGVTQDTIDAIHAAVAAKYLEPTIFDAIVDARGNGDFLSVAAAFAAGKTSVFVRDGVYIETSDIVLPDGGQLMGESQSNVKIVLVAGNSVKVDGSGGLKINTGTVTATHNSATVVGTSTSFTTLLVGSYILLGTNFYEIASIESDTSLTLYDTYRGQDLVNIPCLAQRMHTGARISNLVIANSSSTGLYIRAVRHCAFRGVAVMRCSPNIHVADSGDSSLCEFICGFSNGVGLTIENAHSMLFSTLDVYNSSDNGIIMTAGSSSNVIDSSSSSNNTGTGLLLTSNTMQVNVKQTVTKNNKQDGIYTDSTSEYLTMTGCTIAGNGGVGINYLGSYGVLSNNTVQKNGSHGIVADMDCTLANNLISLNQGDGLHSVSESGEDMIVSSNQFDSNTGNGITLSTANSVIANNSIRDNAAMGIEFSGVNGSVTGNIVRNNGSHGISLAAETNECIVASNHVKGNTSHGIYLASGLTDNFIHHNFISGNGTNMTIDGQQSVDNEFADNKLI